MTSAWSSTLGGLAAMVALAGVTSSVGGTLDTLSTTYYLPVSGGYRVVVF